MSDLDEHLTAEQRRSREDLHRAFRDVLSQPSGKRVLFWILEQCAIYQDAFSGQDATTNYTLGLQAGGRRVIGMMDAIDPRLYPKLLLDISEIKAMAVAAKQETENDDDLDG